MMLSIRQHIEIAGQDVLLQQLKIISPVDYSEFIEALYSDLDVLTGFLESDPKDTMFSSEDFLNREIVRLLKARNYHASHDTDSGGHVDIHVRSGNHKFSWLGEAKIYRGPSYLQGGLSQLIDRYAQATPNHNCGGIVVYFQEDNASDKFASWRKHLESNELKLVDLAVSDCNAKPGLAFYSEFVHPRIGSVGPRYKIRHLGLSLFRQASAQPPGSPPTSST